MEWASMFFVDSRFNANSRSSNALRQRTDYPSNKTPRVSTISEEKTSRCADMMNLRLKCSNESHEKAPFWAYLFLRAFEERLLANEKISAPGHFLLRNFGNSRSLVKRITGPLFIIIRRVAQSHQIITLFKAFCATIPKTAGTPISIGRVAIKI